MTFSEKAYTEGSGVEILIIWMQYIKNLNFQEKIKIQIKNLVIAAKTYGVAIKVFCFCPNNFSRNWEFILAESVKYRYKKNFTIKGT